MNTGISDAVEVGCTCPVHSNARTREIFVCDHNFGSRDGDERSLNFRVVLK